MRSMEASRRAGSEEVASVVADEQPGGRGGACLCWRVDDGSLAASQRHRSKWARCRSATKSFTLSTGRRLGKMPSALPVASALCPP